MEDDDAGSVVAAKRPFRFFDLPYELRLRVYEAILYFPDKTLDLDPSNYRSITRVLLPILLVSHRMHDEAYRVFYGRNTFRLFPVHGRFFHTKKPLLARLSPRYRSAITRLEVRLGPGWTKPPRGWVVDGKLGLVDTTKVRFVRVFVECDPASHPIFEGFRVGQDFYTEFSVNLIKELIAQTPSIIEFEFDGYPSVTRSSPLLQAVIDVVKAQNRHISWGTERGWEQVVEVNLAGFMRKLNLGAP